MLTFATPNAVSCHCLTAFWTCCVTREVVFPEWVNTCSLWLCWFFFLSHPLLPSMPLFLHHMHPVCTPHLISPPDSHNLCLPSSCLIAFLSSKPSTISSRCFVSPSSPFFLPSSTLRADFLVLREGASEPPWAAALLRPAPHLVRAGPGPGLAALCPQWALAGALPAHAIGGPCAPGVSKVFNTIIFFYFCVTSKSAELYCGVAQLASPQVCKAVRLSANTVMFFQFRLSSSSLSF